MASIPHDNMEIVTIPLTGALEHQDSMGNKEVLHAGEVQAMSAGTGIFHSEYNAKADEPCTLLQIWIFPEERNVTPQYAQTYYDVDAIKREWHAVVNPIGKGDGLGIHQQAWFNLTRIPAGERRDYALKRAENGVYFFVIEGGITLDSQPLSTRDAAGVWGSRILCHYRDGGCLRFGHRSSPAAPQDGLTLCLHHPNYV